MRFFSGNGDNGETSLPWGKRANKSDPVFELIGTLDELSANLGLAISFCDIRILSEDLRTIQTMLSDLMGIVAGSTDNPDEISIKLKDSLIWIEKKIDNYGEKHELPTGFVFPGKTTCGAAIDIARTVARRAERNVVRLSINSDKINKDLQAVINRLSSLLFVIRLIADSN